jgi:cyclohexadieny/prephenate dehydrogenase
MSAAPIFEKIALIGVGLIGSSIAHASRRANLAGHIAGYVPRADTRARAEKIGFADSLHADLATAVDNADLVVLATPVGAYAALAEAFAPHLKPGAIVTDVGSVKSVIVKDISPHIPRGVHFIPGHPIAGTEQSGPEAGFAELFDGRWCILTPVTGTDAGALARLKEFWQRCGSDVDIMDPEHHDLVLAITSHVPHLIAYSIVGTAADLETVTRSEVIKYSASGFRFHPHCRFRPHDVARRLSQQSRGRAGNTGPLQRRSCGAARAVRWGDGEALFNLSRARGR